jgi:hypothetical protein
MFSNQFSATRSPHKASKQANGQTIHHSLCYGRQVTIEKRSDKVLYNDRLPDRACETTADKHGKMDGPHNE